MSQDTSRRALITGIGLVSPIGIGREVVADNLRAGRTGISKVEQYVCTAPPGGIGGEVKDFTDESAKKLYLKDQRKWIKVMCREIQLGSASAVLALSDSNLNLEAIDHTRLGVVFGANLMVSNPDTLKDPCEACTDSASRDFEYDQWGDIGLPKMEPLWLLKYLPNMPACHIAMNADARGPSNSVTMDDVSGNVCLNEAHSVLRRGAADVMVVGTTGTRLNSNKSLRAVLWDQIGYDPEHPEASCKPFDTHRNGQVVGEGAGCVILEREDHALARGAKVYGTLLGGGSSCVANKDGVPDIRLAIVRAGQAALKSAKLTSEQIGHVSACGLGDSLTDIDEALAIHDLFGARGSTVPVNSFKGYFGNSAAGAGVLEVAADLLGLQDGLILPTLGCEHPDPKLNLNVVHGSPLRTDNKVFMKISYTRIGQASVSILQGA